MPASADPVGALDRLLEVTVLLGQDMADALAAQGLSVARATLLWHLRARGPSPQRALAEALDVSPRNATGLVEGLADGALGRPAPPPTDRRARLGSCTGRGTRLVERLAEQQAGLAGQLFGGLPSDRLAVLVDGLDEVLGRLRVLVAAERQR